MGPILARSLNNIYNDTILIHRLGRTSPKGHRCQGSIPQRTSNGNGLLPSISESNGIQRYTMVSVFESFPEARWTRLLRLKLDSSDSLIRMCFAFNSSNLGQQLATKYWSHWHTRTHREEARLFEGFDPPDRHRHKTHHNEVLSQHHRCEQRSRSPQSIGRCACPPWQPHQSRFATQCQCR